MEIVCLFVSCLYVFVLPVAPSNPYSVRLSAVSQRLATVTFMKPDSHGGVPINYYLVQYKEVGSQDWRDVKSHSVQSKCKLYFYSQLSLFFFFFLSQLPSLKIAVIYTD